MDLENKPITYLWAQGGDFLKFEQSLGLDFGYPAVISISLKKLKFATMRTSFNDENLKVFIIGVLTGSEVLADVPRNLPQLETVNPWIESLN